MDKYSVLQKELVSSLTKRLLNVEYDLGKRNFFFADVAIDHHIFDILSDHLWRDTKYARTVSELIESEADRNAFDRQVRECVYDDLYKALGGLP
ncbi:hypothetical protein [Limnohabitans parvus]|uniref:hypothetical protein n=1 Tax=Limnohabitans parvus TaxID=540061 RepID=UPI0011B29729|nr:hypothetical protein [Limnohabitans parvus]